MSVWPRLVVVGMLLVGTSGMPAPAGAAPNIVLIVADDLGWTDLGCFGSRYYRTPHIDRLARQGLRFTAAYSCGPNCAPTRACLMSGQYTPRHGVYTVGSGARGQAKFRKLVPVSNVTVLRDDIVTLAETLHAAGYATAHFGKWHLGPPPTAGPKQQGFDVNFGGNRSGSPRGGYFAPYKNPQLPDGPTGENLTDRLSSEAARFIEQHRDRPFFVYLPFYAVHTPIQAKPELAAEYQRRKPHGGHRNPRYAAMVETMDAGVGRVLETLDRFKLAKNTLVMFTSDNGGLGGYRALGGSTGRNITDNAPLRGGKGMLYEGGIRVPLIARWPGRVKAGGVCPTPVITVDFYPTLTAVAGTSMPDGQAADGVNFTALLAGGSLPARPLFWHFPGYLQASARAGTWRTTPAGAIRSGNWKLIEFFEDGRRELYSLERDIGESKNLLDAEPEVAARLFARLTAWRRAVTAPMPKKKKAARDPEP